MIRLIDEAAPAAARADPDESDSANDVDGSNEVEMMGSRIMRAELRPASLVAAIRIERRIRRSPRYRTAAAGAAFRYGSVAFLLALFLAAPAPATAQVEVEADPFAYGLNGFSLHVAGIAGSYRLSLGTFGIDVPRFLHGNDAWSISMRGAGIKTDLLGRSIDGFFVGADANYYRMSYTLDDAAETTKRDEYSVGLRGGYRLPIGRAGLYLSPWVGIGYIFSDGDVVIREERFGHSPISIFPTVHVGWRF